MSETSSRGGRSAFLNHLLEMEVGLQLLLLVGICVITICIACICVYCKNQRRNRTGSNRGSSKARYVTLENAGGGGGEYDSEDEENNMEGYSDLELGMFSGDEDQGGSGDSVLDEDEDEDDDEEEEDSDDLTTESLSDGEEGLGLSQDSHYKSKISRSNEMKQGSTSTDISAEFRTTHSTFDDFIEKQMQLSDKRLKQLESNLANSSHTMLREDAVPGLQAKTREKKRLRQKKKKTQGRRGRRNK